MLVVRYDILHGPQRRRLLPEHVSTPRHLRTECERRVDKREGGGLRGDHEDEVRSVVVLIAVPINPESPERFDRYLRGSLLAVFREPESSSFWIEPQMNERVWHASYQQAIRPGTRSMRGLRTVMLRRLTEGKSHHGRSRSRDGRLYISAPIDS